MNNAPATDPVDRNLSESWESTRSLAGVSRVTRDICDLPTVATLDWCDRAAAAAARLSAPSHVLLLITTADESGSLAAPEAVGVAASPEPHTVDSRRLAVGSVAEGNDDASIEMLRSRAYRLSALGFAPGRDGLRRASAAPLSRHCAGFDWRAGVVGKLWNGIPTAEVVIGLASMSAADPCRILVVQIATTAPDHALPGMLTALLPTLADRALKAIGPTKTDPRSWLTPREQEVLEQLTLGRSVKQIAESLARSPHTVHDHVKALHKKLGANTRGELIARALGHIAREQADTEPPTPIVVASPARAATRSTSPLLREAV